MIIGGVVQWPARELMLLHSTTRLSTKMCSYVRAYRSYPSPAPLSLTTVFSIRKSVFSGDIP